MTDNHVNKVVSQLLRNRLGDVGFEYSTVKSEEDFDGATVLRVTVYFSNGGIASDRPIEAFDELQSELMKRGEERFVSPTANSHTRR